MATTKITDLTAYTDPVSTDVVPIVDVTSDVTKKVSIADLMENAGSGTEALPGISFDGDPNTGIYRPGADQVAISTGGFGRLFIDAGGSVGVNTASITNVGSSIVPLEIKGNATDRSGALVLSTSDVSVQAYSYIVSSAYRTGTSTNHDSIFITNNTPRLYITSTGEFEFTGAGTAGTTQAVYFSGSAPVNSLVVDSSGNVGIGTTSVDAALHIQTNTSSGNGTELLLQNAYTTPGNDFTGNTIRFRLNDNDGTYDQAFLKAVTNENFGRTSVLAFGVSPSNSTNATEKMRLTSTGLGIGTTSPTRQLDINDSSHATLALTSGTSGQSSIFFADTDVNVGQIAYFHSEDSMTFRVNDGERARIDSDGRLLVGTSSARSNFAGNTSTPLVQIEGVTAGTASSSVVRGVADSTGPTFNLGKTRGASVGQHTVVVSGDQCGVITFQGADGTNLIRAAQISAEVDGTPGSNDMPGRLVFSTTADGASSPTERMRIQQNGSVLIGKTSDTFGAVGTRISAGGVMTLTAVSNELANFNRLTTDGVLLYFTQDSATEGSISVSGSTVSYNGAHLSRWSQLPGGVERTEILRGSVLSNIDEMCEWGEEDNEQLNRMKVSDVEGDKNVSGVFQAWDDDDDTYTNDFYCAMTGDFVIRIAQGVTVERGDLLMSAGDGTAKPQDDDIIRSKTIAKVTSTNVSCTYDDGSYCVPCVLMAC